MKKNEKHFAVNNQEDEDGYTVYSVNVTSNENINGKQVVRRQTNKTENPKPGFSGSESRRFNSSPSPKHGRTNKN